jgi:hypothetical protein
MPAMAESTPANSLPPLADQYIAAIKLIDAAHAEDPTIIEITEENSQEIMTMPYELHYAAKMTRWLAVRCPEASATLQVAIRAQHFKRQACGQPLRVSPHFARQASHRN